MKAVGSAPLGERVAALQPHLHVFGHTHFGWDAEIDEIRYVQAALATPKERRRRMRTLEIGGIASEPLEIYNGARTARFTGRSTAAFAPRRHAVWSEYYRHTDRTPGDVEPAPWVLEHYRARAPRRVREEDRSQ